MYSSKENVNILTALLVKHGVRHAVVCPGSRNAPIAHNLNTCPDITCFSVVDERSAGFYALGLTLQSHRPVAICVTSGTALLNLAPAVAEAFYLRKPLIIISADRPLAWIDQQDGQTLPQPDALGRFVRKAVTLPEPMNDEQRWHTNRLINEALLEATRLGDAPVHINIPISEPLFDFSVEALPDERCISLCENVANTSAIDDILTTLCHAQRPMIVVGQTDGNLPVTKETTDKLNAVAVVLHEALATLHGQTLFDEALYHITDETDYQPDFIVYLGGSIVSKRLKAFLRRSAKAKTWIVNPRGELYDTFGNLQGIIECTTEKFIGQLARYPFIRQEKPFLQRWTKLLQSVAHQSAVYEPPYSQMAAVKAFEQRVERLSEKVHIHYANSTSVRLANIYARHFVHCNRGVNGIDGTLSTAAGSSLLTEEKVFCVTGDLSFFYDQNALWNQHLRGNFRIVLLNNGCGGIFRQLRGLEASPARDTFISACHGTTAEGICHSHRMVYLSATNMEQLHEGLDRLTAGKSERPMLLEVQTSIKEDENAFREYYKSFTRAAH